MLDATQFREHIVRPALQALDPEIPYSLTAENLLMGTAMQESNLTYLVQINGPALGVFQMEPNTHRDIWKNYLHVDCGRPFLAHKILRNDLDYGDTRDERLVWDLQYATQMARVHYWRVPAPLPADNPHDLAKYWKRHYNTHLGRGRREEFVANYERLPGNVA